MEALGEVALPYVEQSNPEVYQLMNESVEQAIKDTLESQTQFIGNVILKNKEALKENIKKRKAKTQRQREENNVISAAPEGVNKEAKDPRLL